MARESTLGREKSRTQLHDMTVKRRTNQDNHDLIGIGESVWKEISKEKGREVRGESLRAIRSMRMLKH